MKTLSLSLVGEPTHEFSQQLLQGARSSSIPFCTLALNEEEKERSYEFGRPSEDIEDHDLGSEEEDCDMPQRIRDSEPLRKVKKAEKVTEEKSHALSFKK